MIFLTVGTLFPFDRLVRAVDDVFDRGLIDEEMFAQIGESSYKPRNFESVAFLAKEFFDERLKRASGVIGHAGMGTIAMAMDNNKPLLVMPRLRKHNEHVNDHQVAIARKFARLGHILLANDIDELLNTLPKLKEFVPRPRQANPKAVADRVSEFIGTLIRV